MSKEKDEKLKALGLVMDKLDKQYGKGTIMKMGDKQIVNVDTISTGSLGLDIALGIGGFPKGRIVEIYGPESSGLRQLHEWPMWFFQKIQGRSSLLYVHFAIHR